MLLHFSRNRLIGLGTQISKTKTLIVNFLISKLGINLCICNKNSSLNDALQCRRLSVQQLPFPNHINRWLTTRQLFFFPPLGKLSVWNKMFHHWINGSMLCRRMISAYSRDRRYVADYVIQRSSRLAICLAARAGIEHKLQST